MFCFRVRVVVLERENGLDCATARKRVTSMSMIEWYSHGCGILLAFVFALLKTKGLGFDVLRVEFLLKTDSGYPKDNRVKLCTLAAIVVTVI